MSQKPRFTCDWIWNQLVVLSDGKVVCGCADPYGERPLGDLRTETLHDIWNSERVQQIRGELNDGHSPFCEPCGLKWEVDDDYQIEQRPLTLEKIPRIFLEPAVGCNISCFEAVCNQTSGIVTTRRERLMKWDDFARWVDSVGEDLVRLDFFNYGESLVHPRAIDMLEYIKERYPQVFVYLSTNGLLLDDEKMERIVKAGVDEITFSVDGPDHDTYVKYRVKGDFDQVFGTMRRFVEIRDGLGSQFPYLNWRYIIFKWNDSDEKMTRTRELARQIGIDKLVWEITNHPPSAASAKYQPGTDAWKSIYYEVWDTSQTCNAIPGKQLLAAIDVLADGPIHVSPEQGRAQPMRVRNTGGALWRRAADGFRRSVRLGAQLHAADGKMIDRDWARVFLPDDLPGGEETELEIELPPLSEPGRYRLKFDMVSEGIDWFESGNSPVTWHGLEVAADGAARPTAAPGGGLLP